MKEKEGVEGGSSTIESLKVKDHCVVGVLDLESYHICMKCKGKVQHATTFYRMLQ